MANVIKTVMTYPLNGSTRDFNIPFEYLARKFVQVTLLGKDRKVLTLNTDYRFSTKTTITTTQAWGNAQGYSQIEIRRYTSATERLVDFTDGSILRAYDLNIAQIQTMHVAEEARDLTADTIGVNNEGHLDARGRRIVNLGNAVNDRDAVPFGQLKTMNQNAWDAQNKAQQFRNEAQTFRNQAETFKTQAEGFKNQAAASQGAAKTSENNAKNSENAANASKGAAATSASAAKTSETNAKNSENAAKSQADLAKKWANNPRNQVVASGEYSAKHYSEVAKEESAKLGNWNQLAGTVESVSGTDVAFKGKISAKSGISTTDALRVVEPVSQGPGLSQDMVYTQNLWRAGAEPKGVVEEVLNYGSKRNDIYQFNWDDPATWPDGRSNGKGVHYFYGKLVANTGLESTSRYYSKYSWGGSYAGQLNDNAAFAQSLPGNQDGNIYYPIVKQYGRRSNGYPTALSFGLTSQGKNGFHVGNIVLSGDNNNTKTWGFNMDGTFSSPIISSADIRGTNVSVGGWYKTTGQTGLIMQNANRRHIQFHTGSVVDGYFFKDPGAQPYYMNFGSAAACEYKWESNGHFTCSKGWAIASDGNLKGSKWGGGWIDTWVSNNFKKKTKAWTQVWAGTLGGGASATLSQDIRFRTVWLRIGGGENRYMPFQCGPDGQYYVAGWGDGWIKIQVFNNGRGFKNIQDKSTIPTQIMVENE